MSGLQNLFPRASKSFLRANSGISLPPAPPTGPISQKVAQVAPTEPPAAEAVKSKPKAQKRVLVARTRNGGTWTEAQFWGRIRGALRKTFAAWVPMRAAMVAARRPSQRADRPLLKFEYQCAACKNWFPLKEEGKDGENLVQVDHKNRAGRLRNYDDLTGWITRLTDEDPNSYQVMCRPCHQEKTNREREAGERQGDLPI